MRIQYNEDGGVINTPVIFQHKFLDGRRATAVMDPDTGDETADLDILMRREDLPLPPDETERWLTSVASTLSLLWGDVPVRLTVDGWEGDPTDSLVLTVQNPEKHHLLVTGPGWMDVWVSLNVVRE